MCAGATGGPDCVVLVGEAADTERQAFRRGEGDTGDRAWAANQRIRPGVLIRQWVEQRSDADGGAGVADLDVRVECLGQEVFSGKRAS